MIDRLPVFKKSQFRIFLPTIQKKKKMMHIFRAFFFLRNSLFSVLLLHYRHVSLELSATSFKFDNNNKGRPFFVIFR